MNREILFRGVIDNFSTNKIDPKEFIWTQGYLVVPPDFPEMYNIHNPHLCAIYNVLPATVGQYTGIYDKTCKKIFEGDILQADNGHIGWVEFKNGKFVKVCSCHKDISEIYSDNETIIGNIYQNLELVKEGK